ncbi:MAG TPA: nucleolar RNA-binding Nop10p family protein [Candidatus Nanoarchaeia archaeon]|nr:nucleolar RNA-binding Nop10p family protein [Candidatus Nanoarchaeia archaeon]
MNRIYFCPRCKDYTLKRSCCGLSTIDIRPGKLNLDEKYSKYRLKYKKLL